MCFDENYNNFRYNKQNEGLRFGNFTFGPVVMRMYYHLNKPDIALKVR